MYRRVFQGIIFLVVLSLLSPSAWAGFAFTLEKDVPYSEVPARPTPIAVAVYPSPAAASPAASQAFPLAQLLVARYTTFSGEGAYRIRMNFTETDALARDMDLWWELTMNGTVIGVREPVPQSAWALFSEEAETAASAPWGGITGVPAGLDDGDDDTLAALACSPGETVIRVGDSWTCGFVSQACLAGDFISCYTGPEGTMGIGLCAPGSRICDQGTFALSCTEQILPAAESCDGLDNDCNGASDDALTAPPNTNQAGVCSGSSQSCTGAGGWADDYSGIAAHEAPEVSCDGLDNDCDGTEDNGLLPPPCPLAQGVCAGATPPCGGAGGWLACDYGLYFEAAEVTCDGLDNDCDGITDEDGVCASFLDVVFLFDTTASMGDEVAAFQTDLTATIIPAILADHLDAAFAVAGFEDFPVAPYGIPSDLPYYLLQSLTDNQAALQSAADSLTADAGSGNDFPESGNEALYQTATGEGLVTPDVTVPPGPLGYRHLAPPIVVVVTDAEFHNIYSGFSHHNRAEAVNALRNIDARVIGIVATGTSAVRDAMEDYAADTYAEVPATVFAAGGMCPTGLGGALRTPVAGMCPLVFEIGSDGTGLADAVTQGVLVLGSTY